jgi:GNAT superfamily N-acetyltransferase
MMHITVRRVGIEQMSEVRRIMQLAFEEYRGRLVRPSGALTETIEEVRAVINCGAAFLPLGGDVTVGSAGYRLFPDHAYAERMAVLPEYRGRRVSASGPVFPRTFAFMRTSITVRWRLGHIQRALTLRSRCARA